MARSSRLSPRAAPCRALACLLAALFCTHLGAVEYFPLDQVRLLDSPFQQAQERNLEYVMALDPDRLLAPYLREAGLAPAVESYGNWENTGLDGHIGGHYLTALSLAVASTGRQDVRDRLGYMLDELERAQLANGDGYLGGIPDGHLLWTQIADGDIRADLFALNGYWVPWYNLHKTFAGLRDAWLYTGSDQARTMLVGLANWATRLLGTLDDKQIQAMLTTEHGGINEVLADVASITGDRRYLELAEKLSHRSILEPLLRKEDRLTGLHANTQIPKVIGYQRVAREGGAPSWHEAAEFFWNTVVHGRTVAIGGNSVREHFHDRSDFSTMISEIEGPETCNTYNMLRLTRMLYIDDPRQKYIDYYERALYNHILSSQDPDTGGLVYFTPMRPQHYRVYSRPQDAMWCCVGSGIENHMKYGAFIYAHDGNDLFINLYIPSRLEWSEKGLVLRQENRFPDESQTRLVFESDANVTLKLRYPTWAVSSEAMLSINGQPQAVDVVPGSHITLARNWKKGDTITLRLPMSTRQERMPDGSNYYALLYGPIVLSAPVSPFSGERLDFFADDSRMGHIASGQMCPLEQAPVFVSESPDFVSRLVRLPGESLRFRFTPVTPPGQLDGLELIPFFRVHRTRYMLYWPFSTPGQLETRREIDARREAARLELERRTIDKVAPGEQQPESDHAFSGERTEAGVNFGRHWRHAAGWFGYELNDPNGEAQVLRVDYFGADSGRTFYIELNSLRIAEVTLSGEHGPVFHSVDYVIPSEALAASEDGKHSLKFIAAEDSIAGGIYGVRLLRGSRPE